MILFVGVDSFLTEVGFFDALVGVETWLLALLRFGVTLLGRWATGPQRIDKPHDSERLTCAAVSDDTWSTFLD